MSALTTEQELENLYVLLRHFSEQLEPFEHRRGFRSYRTKPENDLHTQIVETMTNIRGRIAALENEVRAAGKQL